MLALSGWGTNKARRVFPAELQLQTGRLSDRGIRKGAFVDSVSGFLKQYFVYD
jgi:hypothetical protein